MIVKEFTAPDTTDRLRRAGFEAERQMAFYLKRAFGQDPDIHVFNGLRLEREGEVAQIDHFVLHRCGAVVVESKSVTTTVRINVRQEWSREYSRQWTGMPSPVLQAQRQVELLRRLLRDHAPGLLGKVILGLLQKQFGALPVDVLVAISDNGILDHKGSLEFVCKADQISERIKSLVVEHKKLANLLSTHPRSKDWGLTLSREEFTRVSAFLRAKHQDSPHQEPAVVPSEPQARALMARTTTPVSSKMPISSQFGPFACKHCSSERLSVVYGKYGYYFKCEKCQGNTPIVLNHPTTRERLKVRKQGLTFYAENENASFSMVFFTNRD